MTDVSNLIIRPLDREHDRQGFNGGVASLDNYIRKQASQDVKRRVSRVFVATAVGRPDVIVDYYRLSFLSIELSQLPEALSRKLPRHPVPAALIGRLAVNQSVQGHGIGRMLLADAIKGTLAVSDAIAIYAMVVDAIDEAAQQFYEQYGFSLHSSESRRLFLPLNSI